MAFSWGSLAIYIIPDTYTPPWAESPIIEIPLAPDPDNLAAVSTVIQQQGKKRDIVSFSTYVKDYASYQGLLSDQVSGTVRTFSGPDGYSESMVILSLSQAQRKIYPTRYEFMVTLMEATP